MANEDSIRFQEPVMSSGMSPRYWILITLLMIVLGRGTPAFADTWRLPTQQQYFSEDKRIRFQVTPRELSGQLDYFQDKVGGKERAGQNPNGSALAGGKLEIKERNHWRVLWDGALVNDVSPTRALVANRGTHVVTFDNWHSVGFGNDVVVIYDEVGKVVRAMGLKDFLPEDYVQALPRSVSSIHWGLAHHLADKDEILVLQVVVPPDDGGMHQEEEPAFIEVRIRLSDGVVVPPSGPAWERAQVAAVRSLASQRAEMEAFRAKRAETITAPANDEQTAWRDYLTEMMARRSTGVEDFPRLFFLPAERDKDYPEDRQMILETLSTGIKERFNPGTQIVFSSPSSARLAELMEQGLAKVLEDSLQGYTVVFAGEQQFNAVVENAVRRTGSNYVFVNVREPLPGQVWPRRQPEKN